MFSLHKCSPEVGSSISKSLWCAQQVFSLAVLALRQGFFRCSMGSFHPRFSLWLRLEIHGWLFLVFPSSLVCGVWVRWVAALLSRQASSARGGQFGAASQRHLFSSLCACPLPDYSSICVHVMKRSAMAGERTVSGTAHFVFRSSRRMLSLVDSAGVAASL